MIGLLLAYNIVVYTSKASENTNINNSFSVSKFTGTFAPPGLENITPYQRNINRAAISKNIGNDQIIIETECILSSPFFTLFKQTISFFLYNLSTLKSVFRSIYKLQANSKLDIEKLKITMLEHSLIYQIQTMKKAFETYSTCDGSQASNLILLCKRYLYIRNIRCNELTYEMLKNKVLQSDLRFQWDSKIFSYEVDRIKFATTNFLHNILNLDNEGKLIFAKFCSLIHELILNFNSRLCFSVNIEMFPILKDHKSLFIWVFDSVSNLIGAPIFDPFFSKSTESFPAYLLNAQHITGFIISLFKIVQFNQANEICKDEIFSFVQNILVDLARHSITSNGQILKDSSIEILKKTFREFLDTFPKKSEELKNIEKKTGNTDTFILMDPFVENFFKVLIERLGNAFLPYDFSIMKGKNQ